VYTRYAISCGFSAIDKCPHLLTYLLTYFKASCDCSQLTMDSVRQL